MEQGVWVWTLMIYAHRRMEPIFWAILLAFSWKNFFRFFPYFPFLLSLCTLSSHTLRT